AIPGENLVRAGGQFERDRGFAHGDAIREDLRPGGIAGNGHASRRKREGDGCVALALDLDGLPHGTIPAIRDDVVRTGRNVRQAGGEGAVLDWLAALEQLEFRGA